MKFLIAPNAYKGTLTALEASRYIQEQLAAFYPKAEIRVQPLADGGDGTCDLLCTSLGIQRIKCLSLNAIGKPIEGHFGWDESNKVAFLDVSTSSGLANLGVEERNTSVTSTYGTGILIQEALKRGANQVVLGLGGSSTIDLGVGILQALGFLFLDAHGRELPAFCPDLIATCKHIQRPLKQPQLSFTLLCDVKNPFFGSNGAVRIFGPQKGLHPEDIEQTEKINFDFFNLLVKKTLSEKWVDLPGFGAAGGIALGLNFFFPSQIEFGSSYFFERVNLHDKVGWADWIITGEGQYDQQSEEGKACFELKNIAQKLGKKIALIASSQGELTSEFDVFLELPPLNFSDPAYKNKAQDQFQGLLKEAILKGVFD